VFNKYLEGAKLDGAEIKTVAAEGADRMIVSANIGLIDVLFLRGNVVGGANGATEEKPAEASRAPSSRACPPKSPRSRPEIKARNAFLPRRRGESASRSIRIEVPQ